MSFHRVPNPDHPEVNSALFSRYHCFVCYEQSDYRGTVDALVGLLPHIPRESWPARLHFGGVYVNGRLVREDCPLPSPCKLEYYEPKFPLERAQEFYPAFQSDWILYEDVDIVIAFKPNRLPSLPTKEQVIYSLRTYLDEYYDSRMHMPSRLDTSTQGIVLVCRSSRSHKAFQQLYEKRLVKKGYRFFTAGQPSWDEYELNAPVGKDPHHPVLRCVGGKDGKDAMTRFRVLERRSTGTLLQAEPLTGRTHQIRVHASHLGFPICGDRFYGGERADTLHLFSFSLDFPHPFGGVSSFQIPERLMPGWVTYSGFG